jgi:hypothetical protein
VQLHQHQALAALFGQPLTTIAASPQLLLCRQQHHHLLQPQPALLQQQQQQQPLAALQLGSHLLLLLLLLLLEKKQGCLMQQVQQAPPKVASQQPRNWQRCVVLGTHLPTYHMIKLSDVTNTICTVFYLHTICIQAGLCAVEQVVAMKVCML